MRKFILSSLVLILVSSCSTYDYRRFNGETANGSACANPQYVSTMSKSAVVFQPNAPKKYMPESLTMYNLLFDARVAHGNDVTIQNVRYDVKNGRKKVSVVYDVVKCK
jgi:hypothetical protein